MADGNGKLIALGVVGVLALAVLTTKMAPPAPAVPVEPAPAPSSSAVAVQVLNDKQLALCAKAIAEMTRTGLIKDRPSARRIDVEEANWAALPSKDKNRLLQFLSCDAYRQTIPPGSESVVAYGYRSGERLRMLTSAGVI